MATRKDLPIEVAEQIVAMMPYPSIFKCRCLSKVWLAWFAAISSEADEAEKGRAILFQKQVRERSNSWKTLCPVFSRNNQDFLAYDRVCHKSRRLLSLPLPKAHSYGKWGQKYKIQIEGALVYAFDPGSIESAKYIANSLTGVGKQLPACSIGDQIVITEKLVSSSELYKVILLGSCHFIRCRGCGGLHIQIYDSKLDAWSTKKVVSSIYTVVVYDVYNCNTMYLKGVLYFAGYQLNVEEGTLDKLDMLSAKQVVSKRMLASWNHGNLLIVLEKKRYLRSGTGLKVLKFELQSEQLSEIAEWSLPALETEDIDVKLAPVFDGQCIFSQGKRILHSNLNIRC